MRIFPLKSILCIVSVLAGSISAWGLIPVDLRAEGLIDPVGIDVQRPNLSWSISSGERGAKQTAAEVRVASHTEHLQSGEADLWTSGKIDGDSTTMGYRATVPGNHEKFFWQVRVWDANDVASEWSEIASWTMGMVDRHGWKADWITHPEWLGHTRQHLGYRSQAASHTAEAKWLQIDLGRNYPVDTIILHALRHTVAERLGFPVSFRVEVSSSGSPESWTSLTDTTDAPRNIWFTTHTIEGRGTAARYVRLTVPELRELNGEICLALAQIEVRAGGKNVAVGAKVSASDSIENSTWSAASVVDGQGLPTANRVAHQSVELRKDFTLKSDPVRSMVHLSGLGGYLLEINGQRIGDDIIQPGWTNVDETVHYGSFEIEGVLSAGANAIALRLVSGMYSVSEAGDRYTKFVNRFRPVVAKVHLWVAYADGSEDIIASGPDWQTRKGAVTYSHVFGGEDYDARLAKSNWSRAGFDAGPEWQSAVSTHGPDGWLRGVASQGWGIRQHETLNPNAIEKLAPNRHVYDLGQNVSLMPRIKVKGEAGARVRITPAELLAEDGSVDRRSVAHRNRPAYWQYTLAGTGSTESWAADFFYHGGRYLQVDLFAAAEGGPLPVVESLEARVTHADAPAVGTFASSSELYNRTHELIRWAQRSNMFSVLTDCPHRERLGWLEQYHLNGPSIRYEFDLAQHYIKTFQDMMDAQTADGLVPNIAPEFIVFEGAFRDSPEWGSAIVLAVWQQYLFTGDASVLTKYYNAMQAYVGYLRSKAKDGILDHGLGDWYDLGPNPPGFAQLTPRSLTATAIYYECLSVIQRIAAMRGREGEAAAYAEWAEQVRGAFNREFLDAKRGVYAAGSQTAQAMPLVIGLVPEGMEDKVFNRLLKTLADGDHALTSGDVGHRYLLRALASRDRSDIIHRIHHRTDRPGYGWQLERGATSLIEAWDANRQASQNHFMLGHIMEWFYADLVGIQPDPDNPGFRHIIIHPQPVDDLRFAEASYQSAMGPVEVRWDRADGKFRLKLSVPTGSTATVRLPSTANSIVLIGGKPAGKQEGVIVDGYANGRTILKVESGNYQFETTLLP